MLFRLFEITWDHGFLQDKDLPCETIVDALRDNDSNRLKLKLMDQLDAEYNGTVKDLKWEEI
jgi:hypothetical protein